MGAIGSNILDLLAWLRQKGVAMRDLKPDNLFIAGDPAKYPSFLSSAKSYAIGLIDMETAVSFSGKNAKEIKQPQLGGTPYYATPTHLFTNALLTAVYKNLPRIFYLQDWHACAVIIFKIITGETIFLRTAKKLSSIRGIIRKSLSKKLSLPQILDNVNHIFWQSAIPEFYERLGQKESMLKSINVFIRGSVKKMLIEESNTGKKQLAETIKDRVNALFKTEKSRKEIMNASIQKMHQLKANWKNDPAKAEALKRLQELEELKIRYGHLKKSVKALNDPAPVLTAHQLIRLLFETVRIAMYR
jgi:serine/threonine protein kinase